MSRALMFGAYILASTAGLLLIKRASLVWSWQFAAGFTIYGAGFVMWMWLLRRLPLSVAFPTAAGALIVATIVAGRVFLNEKLSLPQIAGMALILGGIVLVFWKELPE